MIEELVAEALESLHILLSRISWFYNVLLSRSGDLRRPVVRGIQPHLS